MNAPPVPEGYTAPQSTFLVPVHLLDSLVALIPEGDPLEVAVERLKAEERAYQDPEVDTLPYQILDVLAKSDGNLTDHMDRRTLNVMYGEMVRNLTRTFIITRKGQNDG